MFHIFVGHLCIIFEKMSIQILCPFYIFLLFCILILSSMVLPFVDSASGSASLCLSTSNSSTCLANSECASPFSCAPLFCSSFSWLYLTYMLLPFSVSADSAVFSASFSPFSCASPFPMLLISYCSCYFFGWWLCPHFCFPTFKGLLILLLLLPLFLLFPVLLLPAAVFLLLIMPHFCFPNFQCADSAAFSASSSPFSSVSPFSMLLLSAAVCLFTESAPVCDFPSFNFCWFHCFIFWFYPSFSWWWFSLCWFCFSFC